MKARELILNKIKQSNNKVLPLPNICNFGTVYKNLHNKFDEMLRLAGAKTIYSSKEKLEDTIYNLYPNAKYIASNIKGYKNNKFDVNLYKNAKDLKNLDLAIIQGSFAVSENGSIYINNLTNKHKALYFIAQNLIIVCKKENILSNMHEAYKKIDIARLNFSTFISGPSKTADIEQSLVIGAHGPKSSCVIFI